LTSGASWGGEVPVTERDFGDLKWEFRADVGGSRQVETDVGPVDAVRVTITERPVNLGEFREAVEQEAREDDGALDQLEYSASRRTQLDYAPELGMIVRLHIIEQEKVFVSGTDEGEAFSYRGEEQYEEEWTLAGLQKTSRPARDLDYIVRALAGDVAVADPTGVLPSMRDVQLSVNASEASVNAAEENEVTFRAHATENGRDAAGVDLRWSLLDYANRQVASADGGEVTWTFDEPGLYSVKAAAYDAEDEDVLLAAVETPFEAYFDGEITLTNPVGVFGVPQEAAGMIPVRPGIRELSLTASPMVTVPFDQLIVEDADSQMVEDADSSAERVRVTDFAETAIGPEDWRVVWSSWVDAAAIIPVHVEARYAAPSPEAAQDASGSTTPGFGLLGGRVGWWPHAADDPVPSV
jgi:hypothetical protein